MARRVEVKRLIKMQRDQADARRVKRQELREQMEELGLDQSVATEAMERMYIEDEEILQASKTHLTLDWEKHFTHGKKLKNIKAMANAEHNEHMDEMEPDEPEDGEEALEGEHGGEGGVEGEKAEGKGEVGFAESDDDPGISSEEEEAAPKAEPKERKKRKVDPNKQIL